MSCKVKYVPKAAVVAKPKEVIVSLCRSTDGTLVCFNGINVVKFTDCGRIHRYTVSTSTADSLGIVRNTNGQMSTKKVSF